MKYENVMDADEKLYNTFLFHNKTRTYPQLKHFRAVALTALLTFTLAGCNNVGVEVSGAIGTFKVTNNGADEMLIIEDGLYAFPKSLDEGDSYDVEVVPSSDTSEGHQCIVSDGSGIMVSGGVTVLVNCHGV